MSSLLSCLLIVCFTNLLPDYDIFLFGLSHFKGRSHTALKVLNCAVLYKGSHYHLLPVISQNSAFLFNCDSEFKCTEFKLLRIVSRCFTALRLNWNLLAQVLTEEQKL